MEIAHLIIKAESQGVEKAAENLDKTAKAAGRAEVAVDKLQKAKDRWVAMEQAASLKQFTANQKLEDQFKRNTQSYIAMSQKRAEAVDNAFKRNEQTFIMGEQRRAAAAIEAERKIQEARQQTIDKARLENRFSGAAGGWGGGGGGGGGILGQNSFGAPKGPSRYSLAPEVSIGNMASTLGPFYSAVGSIFAANSIKNTIVEMETMQAKLLSIAGSSEKADAIFAKLKILDRQLPHDIAELTNAFTLLVHSGFEPSERALRSLSSLSSYSTESVNDVVIAMQRATQGEFRNLKKYGVAAQAEGERIRFTFNGVTEVVNKNSLAIQEYFMRLSEQGTFAKATENKMNTLAGSISNLESAWMSFVSGASTGTGISTLLSTAIKGITMALDGWDIVIGGMVRMVERVGRGLAHLADGEFGKAFELMKEGGLAAVTVGTSEMAAYARERDAKAAKANMKSLQAPAVEQAAIAQALRLAQEEERKVVEMELRFSDEMASLNDQYRQAQKEIDELEIKGDEDGKRRFEIKLRAYEDYSRKVRTLENKKRTDSLARSASIRSRVEASWDEGEKRKREFEFFLGKKDGDESAIFAEHTKMQQYVLSMTAAGSMEEEKALEIVNKNTLKKFSELAEDRKDVLRQEYEDRERMLQRAFKNGDVKEIERINRSKANWQSYVDSVAKISVGGGTVEAPDPGASPFFPSDDEMARKNRAEPFRPQDEKIAQLQSDHEIELRMMRDLHDAGEIQTKEYHERMREEHRRYQDDLREIGGAGARMVVVQNLQMQAQVLGMAGNIAGQLDQLAQENSDAAKATFLAVKAISIAQAIVNTHLGATQALALGPYGIPMSTVILGMGYASAALMAATSVQEYSGKFADGGFLGGGQTTGDRVLFHGNAGEAVLNGQQQRNFMALANGQASGGKPAVNVYVYNNASGTSASARMNEMGDIEVMIEELDKRGAAKIMEGSSRQARAYERKYGLRRQGVA